MTPKQLDLELTRLAKAMTKAAIAGNDAEVKKLFEQSQKLLSQHKEVA